MKESVTMQALFLLLPVIFTCSNATSRNCNRVKADCQQQGFICSTLKKYI